MMLSVASNPSRWLPPSRKGVLTSAKQKTEQSVTRTVTAPARTSVQIKTAGRKSGHIAADRAPWSEWDVRLTDDELCGEEYM